MLVVDSCGWLEALTAGPLADVYREAIESTAPRNVFVPAVVLYEVYKVVKARRGEAVALEAALRLRQHPLVPMDEALAMQAADAAIAHGLAMADALVFASARRCNARLLTSDADLKGLPGVHFIPKPESKNREEHSE